MATILFMTKIDNQKIHIETCVSQLPNFKTGDYILLDGFIDNRYKELFEDVVCIINGNEEKLIYIFDRDYEFKINKIIWGDVDVIWVDIHLSQDQDINIISEIYDI